jgi:N-acetyl-gamma-glutamyl-phosphate reductase
MAIVPPVVPVSTGGSAPFGAGFEPGLDAAHSALAESHVAPKRGKTAMILVLGASGYSGQEFARLALGHEGLRLVALCSRENAGRPAAELLPGVDPRERSLPTVLDPADAGALVESGVCDTVIACLPHGAWTQLVTDQPALTQAPRIVDLSSDHRDGNEGYVYGLPEAFRDSIASATKIANPGCYPTAATLALLPAAELGWLRGPVMVHALSGVTGAGRTPALRTSFVELDGGASIYKAGDVHPHVSEMERNFARLGQAAPVAFVPHLAPMARGIVLTATVQLAHPVSPEEAHAAWVERYADEPFVRVLAPGHWPETRQVRGSNRCDVAVTTLHGGTTLLATAAIDNLVKGASGQAIQNLNLMLGWPEGWNLPVHGAPW